MTKKVDISLTTSPSALCIYEAHYKQTTRISDRFPVDYLLTTTTLTHTVTDMSLSHFTLLA